MKNPHFDAVALTDPQVYADWYGHEHTDGSGLRDAVYGPPELLRDQILPAPLIATRAVTRRPASWHSLP